jgi:nicotinamidase-related amidase
MDINSNDTALVVVDPQNDFLSEQGVTWQLVGDSVKENGTIENIEQLFQTAKGGGYEVFISPHYYYPSDHGWKFGGTIEKVMHEINMFGRGGALSLDGFQGSGADWLERFKPYIEDGKTIIASPHKVYGPENNDLALQLRKRGIDKVVLAGMSANLCVEAHLRELLEQGFEVAVIKDATAGARHPELGDGYQSAIVNFGYMANAVLSTSEAVSAMASAHSASEPSSSGAVRTA